MTKEALNLDRAGTLQTIGIVLLRYGLVIILVLGGASKWKPAEAAAIQPWMQHSPFLRWTYHVMSVQHASEFIGVIELIIAALMATRHWLPRFSALGSSLGILMFLMTLSFLITTPSMDQTNQGFVMKDFFLLAGAVITAGEALAGRPGRSPHNPDPVANA